MRHTTGDINYVEICDMDVVLHVYSCGNRGEKIPIYVSLDNITPIFSVRFEYVFLVSHVDIH